MAALLLLGTITSLAQTSGRKTAYRDTTGRTAMIQYGIASYYSDKFVGKATANGEKYSNEKMTCAHNTLAMGTWIRVTNLRNKKTVLVRVNDRLHHRNPRLVDLSLAAAKQLGYIGRGITRVKVEVLGKKKPVDKGDAIVNK